VKYIIKYQVDIYILYL